MRLEGVEIVVNGQPKFVGKVGRCPRDARIAELAGEAIFYREVPYTDLYSTATDCLGVDAEAWDWASECKSARAMVVYCPDRKVLLVVMSESLDACPKVDLGEYPQYRIPLSKARVIHATRGVNMGWTQNVHRIETSSIIAERNDHPNRMTPEKRLERKREQEKYQMALPF